MIYKLTGRFDEDHGDFIVLDIGGVGYLVQVGASFRRSAPVVGQSVSIYTYHYVREDQLALFGFQSTEERELFILLIGVSGVGPKVGLKIFSYFSYDQLVEALLKGDVASICQVPGVGKKMSERMVIELQDKVSKLSDTPIAVDSNPISDLNSKTLHSELKLAMKTLGYSQDEVKQAIQKAHPHFPENCSLEEGIKVLLKYL